MFLELQFENLNLILIVTSLLIKIQILFQFERAQLDDSCCVSFNSFSTINLLQIIRMSFKRKINVVWLVGKPARFVDSDLKVGFQSQLIA